MNHIELFAGCGGLSLGLESAGFELLLANELSPMAGETFAYNLLKENLRAIADSGNLSSHTRWLSSQHPDLASRLRENPLHYPALGEGVSDIPATPKNLRGKLLIGNIIHLNQLLESQSKLLATIKSGFGTGGIDLVSGGPPCQSFSLAGLRRKDCDKNTLPWEFAKFVENVQPKIAVLENVSGILHAFRDDGTNYHAWFEIAKAFAQKGYVPLCLHINAKLVGVPQNRPRFIMVSMRHDIFSKLTKSLNRAEETLLAPSIKLFETVQANQEMPIEDYRYFDALRSSDIDLYRNSFLQTLVDQPSVSVKEAIDDLRAPHRLNQSSFVNALNSRFSSILGEPQGLENHEQRKNGPPVRRRFRIYQVLQKCDYEVAKEVFAMLRQERSGISDHSWEKLSAHKFLLDDDKLGHFHRKHDLVTYLHRQPTRKHSQRALDASAPAPAALSIPDDVCHYHPGELRTLTVREIARIQSFPDSFVFRSKVTTGGTSRRFEVPQYTQAGNAVPPLLGRAIGLTVKNLLNRL